MSHHEDEGWHGGMEALSQVKAQEWTRNQGRGLTGRASKALEFDRKVVESPWEAR